MIDGLKQAAITSLAKQVNNKEVEATNVEASDFRTELERMLPRLAEASLRGMKPEFLMSSALSLIRSNEALRKCDKTSILHGIMQAALLGLRLDPVLGQCCLVPRKGKAVFMPMYKGIVLLAHRSGKVQDVEAQVVFDKDTFEFEYGSHRHLTHKPALGDRGKALGAYGFITTTNGGEFFEFLPQNEIEKTRDRGGYAPDKSSPWKSDTYAMWEKTALKQTLRLVPTDDPALSNAVALDDIAERGFDQRIAIGEDGKLTHAELTDADPEVPGNAAEETKRLMAGQPVEQDQALLSLLGPPAQPVSLSAPPVHVIAIGPPLPVSQSCTQPFSQSAYLEVLETALEQEIREAAGEPPLVTHGTLETDAEREERERHEAHAQGTATWLETCFAVIRIAMKNDPTVRKVAGEWYAAGKKKVVDGSISNADFLKLDKQFREWFPPKPVEGVQESLPLVTPPAAPKPVVAPPVAPPVEKPPMIAPTGIKVTKQAKETPMPGTPAYAGIIEEFAAEIIKATTIPMVLAVKSKIATSTALDAKQKAGLGQQAQDKFAAIKAQARK